MYFPYLRGRQYELIALRELLENDKLSKKVVPIIEPVKLSSTLINTLERFKNKGRKCSLILNPAAGSFIEEYEDVKKVNLVSRLDEVFKENDKLYHASLMSKNYKVEDNFKLVDDIDKQITICKHPDDLEGYRENYAGQLTAYNVITESGRLKREVSGNKVKIGDRFSKLLRNTDYSKNPDEFFSDDHKYFSEDGYSGFSDYSIVGDEYSESGFAPYAVAIHIVYFDDEENLRIFHFVSDSNLDPTDPAGKFGEALSKLIDKVNEGKIPETLAIREFRRLYSIGSYPGLGTVKKLSIMHHIELVGRYLDGRSRRSR
ncbi:sce7725 family protein [Streptococcus suis]|uniref:sce7725 family protein n=1 Tax=Streptococcus suis TaxID=1307 RepID=UPI00209B9715|nr:sce7725 family protein [Streptococcus suis]MCO8240772.1 sce7725 family protein [Streptococcus suis]